MDPDRVARIAFDEACTTLDDGAAPATTIGAGARDLADRLFRHDPPTPGELEQAIDAVEDALAATRLPKAARGTLVLDDAVLCAALGLHAPGARASRDAVEARFQRLASVSLGHPEPQAAARLDGTSAARLLILREVMHHLGFEAVRYAGG